MLNEVTYYPLAIFPFEKSVSCLRRESSVGDPASGHPDALTKVMAGNVSSENLKQDYMTVITTSCDICC